MSDWDLLIRESQLISQLNAVLNANIQSTVPHILVYVILTLTTIYTNHATGLPREFAGPGQIFSGGPMPSLFLS
jgi:hypothetical protein